MKPALLLVAAATLGAAGCAQNDISLSIIQMEAVSQMTQCVASATAGSGTVGRDRGLLDVSLVTTTGYIAVPVVRNNLLSNANGVEFNSIQISGANVKLMTTAGAPLSVPSGQSAFFYGAAAGRLDPGGLSPMFIEALPAAAAKALAPMIPTDGLFTVVAEMRPVGQHQGDQVVGGPIDFPIDMCNGCLLEVPGTCPLPADTKVAVPCFPQQDDPTVCCTKAAGGLTCGPAAIVP